MNNYFTIVNHQEFFCYSELKDCFPVRWQNYSSFAGWPCVGLCVPANVL
jgi:hypothetical protein